MEWGSLLAFIGVGIMIFASGAGSALGTSIVGCAAIGGLKRRPEKFGQFMVLSALPGTQGLYGFGGFFILIPYLTNQVTIFQGSAILGAGMAVGITCLISAYHQANVCANTIATISDGFDDSFGKGLVLSAFPELYAIVSFASIFLIKALL